jgi:hypothetical protein
MPRNDIYGYIISIDTYVKTREEMIRELEDAIKELEKEYEYKKSLLSILLGLTQLISSMDNTVNNK